MEVRNKEKFVSALDAIQILKNIENKKGIQIVDWNNVIVISKLGSSDQKIYKSGNEEIKNLNPPLSLIVPGKLNENEKEALKFID